MAALRKVFAALGIGVTCGAFAVLIDVFTGLTVPGFITGAAAFLVLYRVVLQEESQ